MTIRTQLKAGQAAGQAGAYGNHNETLNVRTALQAGGEKLNHTEALQVRSALKAGRMMGNQQATSASIVSVSSAR